MGLWIVLKICTAFCSFVAGADVVRGAAARVLEQAPDTVAECIYAEDAVALEAAVLGPQGFTGGQHITQICLSESVEGSSYASYWCPMSQSFMITAFDYPYEKSAVSDAFV